MMLLFPTLGPTIVSQNPPYSTRWFEQLLNRAHSQKQEQVETLSIKAPSRGKIESNKNIRHEKSFYTQMMGVYRLCEHAIHVVK
jgi:hypothetical protein